jgi:2-amino-4-hydroxy-6-hydroxymethyldihydropteridine diphosphokinase
VGGPVGPAHSYVNAVIEVRCSLGPAAMLRLLKSVERKAGRRTRGKWTARPLDLDIISFKGMRTFWPRRRAGSLTLPHPEAHGRGFVLVPLLMIEPHWFHSGLGVSGKRLLARLPSDDQRAFSLLAAK